MPNTSHSSDTTILELERKLRARDKTIAALKRRVEELSSEATPTRPVLEQTAILEQVLAKRTEELESQHVELHQALMELQLAQSQLLHTQKLEAIGALAAGIAHEINTPTQFASDNAAFLRKSFGKVLGIVERHVTLLDALERGAVDARRVSSEREALSAIKLAFLTTEIPNAIEGALEGLGRIASIVRAMKEFSHPSNGVCQSVDLRDVINTTVTVCRNEWKYVADLETSFDERVGEVPCLRDELSQVILNLVVNAAHAISASPRAAANGKGKITISTHARPGYVEIQIQDNGCGVPASIRHRIFEPFFTTKAVGLGTGQGLAIAYSVIVDKHRGKITFNSTEGVGTTFFVRIPLSEDVEVPSSSLQRGEP